MSDWPVVKLKDAGVKLIDCDHKTPKAQEEGLPYVGIPQLKQGRIVLHGARLISEEDFHHWRRKAKPTPNDVILSRRCNPGETAYVPGDLEIALGQNLVLLRSDGEKLYPPFLRWVVQGPNWWNQVGKFINVGAVFDSLKCANIPDFEIKLPPIAEQIKIAEILGGLDKKIELNRQTNQTLEQIAQAIFKNWFVDFEPVKAKIAAKQNSQNPEVAAMCAISGKAEDQLKGLDEASLQQLKTTANLFPDALVESELGEIPEGWVSDSLGTIMDIAGGTQPPAKEFLGEPKEGYIRLIQIRDYATENHLAFIPHTKKLRTTKKTDIMIARYGASVGRICWGMEGAYNVALVKVICDEHYREYLRTYLSSSVFQLRLAQMSGRSAQAGFNKSDIASFSLVIPGEKIASAYQKLSWCLREQILQSKSEISAIEKLRDSLLPKLLSGEIPLNNFNQDMEVAANG